MTKIAIDNDISHPTVYRYLKTRKYTSQNH
ncbi:hypothetical protein [Enterococcus faecalis]